MGVRVIFLTVASFRIDPRKLDQPVFPPKSMISSQKEHGKCMGGATLELLPADGMPHPYKKCFKGLSVANRTGADMHAVFRIQLDSGYYQ